MATSFEISTRIVEAILARKLAPGSRLGEQQLAGLFDCSRTLIREALMRLTARGMVTVSARRGWFVIEPSFEQAREAFEARLVIETGLLRGVERLEKPALRRLREHIRRQKAAVKGDDVGLRSFLLGDFHVCLAECLGNGLLAETVRDLTARTTLSAMRHQSDQDAAKSCVEHQRVVEALQTGAMARAERLMADHLGTWQAKLRIPAEPDALAELRQALQPVKPARRPGARASRESRKSLPADTTSVGEMS